MSRRYSQPFSPPSISRREGELLLNRTLHPYGACPAALEAAATPPDAPADELHARLRRRLCEIYRVPIDAILLFDGIDRGIRTVVESMCGPLIGFPPSAATTRMELDWPARNRVLLARGIGRESPLEPDIAADLPTDGIAIVDSPSDPLGTILRPADAVRLARACQCLVIDERFAEFAGQSLLALAIEFDNIVLLRSFETWAGLDGSPCSWGVTSPRVARRLRGQHVSVKPEAILAALATLDNLGAVEATLRLVRDERSRLYRLLRKFSFLEPLPSWGPFLTARVGFGARDALVAGLAERGIHVHAPPDAGLENYVRFGIGSRSAMERLRLALLDLATDLMRLPEITTPSRPESPRAAP